MTRRIAALNQFVSKSVDKSKLTLIPISYTKLFPRLVQSHLILLVHMQPFKPIFPKWYNANTHCDYHACHNGFSLDLADKKKSKGVTTDLFCRGVIEYPKILFLN